MQICNIKKCWAYDNEYFTQKMKQKHQDNIGKRYHKRYNHDKQNTNNIIAYYKIHTLHLCAKIITDQNVYLRNTLTLFSSYIR